MPEKGGHHEKVIPGYGLNKVFKCRQGLVEPSNKKKIVDNISNDTDDIRIIIKEDLNQIHQAGFYCHS